MEKDRNRCSNINFETLLEISKGKAPLLKTFFFFICSYFLFWPLLADHEIMRSLDSSLVPDYKFA
ncbi:hypothetical protein NC651_012088 [Populus alba x Populus x berolinensis]|nr:hypothetical protein NC651_012088 [Populus alba x Populus x berolinensis]